MRRHNLLGQVVADVLTFFIFDVAAGAGLGFITYGLHLCWPWLAWVVLGSFLLGFGVFGMLRRPRRARYINKVLNH